MYARWSETHNYKVELISESPSEAGGFKEVIFAVRGEEAKIVEAEKDIYCDNILEVIYGMCNK
jgi:protein subunit release factor B